MVLKNFYLDGSTTPTEVDIPDALASNDQLSREWVEYQYLPFVDSGLAAAEQDPDHPLAFLPDWAARGAYRLAQSANVVQTQLGMDAETNAQDIQDYQKYLEKVPYDRPVLDALIDMSEADSIGEFWDAAATGDGLRAIGNVVGESITQYLPVIAATIAAIPLTAGQSMTAGSVILGSISGLGSMGIEYGAAALGAMNDYLQEQGTNARDDKAVAAVLGNEEKMAEFTEFALKRGIPIGVIDGLSMGFAGKLTASLRKARKSAEEAVEISKTTTPTGTTVTEIGPKVPTKTPERAALGFEALAMQPALGGLGEAVAQQVSGEGFKLGEVALETIAELPGGTAEIGIGLALERRRERKEAELEKLKKDNAIFVERKAEMLRQRKGKEEVSMVEADLVQEGINPETGRPDAEQYESVAFNFRGKPVKEGEEAFNRDSIKFWFNGEIKQPKSKNLVIDYFVRKGYMEKVKGRNKYVWTKAAERRANELNKGFKGIPVEETTPSGFKGTDVDEATPSDFKGTEDLEATVEEAVVEEVAPTVEAEPAVTDTTDIDAQLRDIQNRELRVRNRLNRLAQGEVTIENEEAIIELESVLADIITEREQAQSRKAEVEATTTTEELPSELVEAFNVAEDKEARVSDLPGGGAYGIPDYTPENKRSSGLKGAATKARNKFNNILRRLYPDIDSQQQINILTQLQDMRSRSFTPTGEAIPTVKVDDKIRVSERANDGSVLAYTYKGYTIERPDWSAEGLRNFWRLIPPGENRASDVARTRGELVDLVDTLETSKTEATPTPTPEVTPTVQPVSPEFRSAEQIDEVTPDFRSAEQIDEVTTVTEADIESSEEIDFQTAPTPDALPEEDVIDNSSPLNLELITANLTDETRDFIEEVTPFKLRRQGADRDAIRDAYEANIELIRTAQIHAITKERMPLSQEETDYLQKAFEAESQLIDNIINNNIIATNDEQRNQIKEQNRIEIEKLSGEQLAGELFSTAYKLWHTTRVAEKFRSYRNYARSIIARREARERYNNIGMVLAAPLYENTSLEESKELGRMAAVLDALYGANPEQSILNKNNTTIGDTITLTIPLEPPTPPTKEGEEEAQPIMSKERYNSLLKELGVKAGQTYTLNAKLTEKFKTSQAAFKKMFDVNMVSFMNFMLQATPLHEGIQRRYDDEVIPLKEKVFQSVQQYIADINKLLPDDQKIPKKTVDGLRNVRQDTAFTNGAKDETTTTLQNIMNRIPKDDENAKGIVDTLRNQIQILKLVNDQQKVLIDHPYYLPRLRYGDFYFTVREKETGEVIGYYTETPSTTRLNNKSKKKSLNKIRENVKEIYPSNKFEVGPILNRNADDARAGIDSNTLAKVKKLASTVGWKPYNKNTPEGQMFKDIDNVIVEQGFGRFLAQRDQNVISGYYTEDNRDHYLPIVLSNYIRSAADTASNLDYIRPITRSIEILREGIKDENNNVLVKAQETLANHAQQTEDYIKSPNEPGALFKTFAFHYALGLNFSSAFVNLSQSFVTSLPVLGMIIKDGKASVEIPRALKDATKLFKVPVGEDVNRLSTYGFDFSDPTPPKFLTRNEWNMLRKMYKEGTIQAIVNLDLGAKLQQDLGSTVEGRVSDKTSNFLAKASEASSFMFGSVEQINRIAVALATYRLANRSQVNLDRFRKFSESTLFSEEEMTPETAARMMVYKTQFLIGKENRPELFRGPLMNVATQFLSFVQQYIGMYANVLNMWFGANQDAETRRMGSVLLGSLMLSMWSFAGVMGWPYLENLRQLLRVASKQLAGYEFDLEYGMKEAMNSYLNPYFTDWLLHGPFSRITGIDVRRRIGVGEPIPFNLMQGNLMAATGPAGGLVIDALGRVSEAIKLGDPAMAITSVLPLGPRAFLSAGRGAMTDTPVRTTQGKVLMPGEDLNVVDRLKQGLGFTPMKVAEARQDKNVLRYLTNRARPLQDYYMNQLAEKIAERRREKSASVRRELHQELNEIRKEIQEINKEAIAEGRRDKIIRVTPRALRERVRVILGGQVESLTRAARKRLGGIQRARETLEEYTPPTTDILDSILGD
jgi:hypothetical protein